MSSVKTPYNKIHQVRRDPRGSKAHTSRMEAMILNKYALRRQAIKKAGLSEDNPNHTVKIINLLKRKGLD